MPENRKEPFCNLETCDKECKEHSANKVRMQNMNKLLWLLLVAVLGSGLWQNSARSETEANTAFKEKQGKINEKILEQLNSIEKSILVLDSATGQRLIRIENKIDNHIENTGG